VLTRVPLAGDIPIVIKPYSVDVLMSFYDRSFHIAMLSCQYSFIDGESE